VWNKAEEFRARANACVDRALQATNALVRFEFMETASQWHALADDTEAIAAIRRKRGGETDMSEDRANDSAASRPKP
jgi:hypothetical protein